MSETTEAAEPADEAQQAPDGARPQEAPQEPADAAQEAEQDTPNREAAKYRTKLREAEEQRDMLTAQLDAAHKQIVGGLIADRFSDAEDYWLRGGGIPLDEGGLTVDAEKVAEKVAEILEAAPHLAPQRRPQPNPAQGASASGSTHAEKPSLNWGDVLKRR